MGNVSNWLIAKIGKVALVVRLWKSWQNHWKNAMWWALCSLFGGLAPLWLSIFLRQLHMQPVNIEAFIERGDFALYSAAFLAPAIYQVAVRIKRAESVLQTGALILAALGLAVAASIFTSVNPDSTRSGAQLQPINSYMLNIVSCLLLAFSFLLAMGVFLNEAQLEYPDVMASDEIDQKILSRTLKVHQPEVAPGLKVPSDTEVGIESLDEASLRANFHPEGEQG